MSDRRAGVGYDGEKGRRSRGKRKGGGERKRGGSVESKGRGIGRLKKIVEQ